ncbi:polymer-forming cytoskeletal protein [Haloarchaeobius sp. TZWWS8]|uniref:polymer-forming cytoskeletal protein n=1 Tax=Haloarchaeobius sp. TZWWS8 TaxID=3446121 RepID=UPI003EB6A160
MTDSAGMTNVRRPWKRGRGVTPVVGVVLLVGIVAIGTISLLVFSGVALEQAQDQATDKRVEQSFVEFDRNLQSVAYSDGGARSVPFDLVAKEAAIRHEDAGRVIITMTKGGNTTTIVNKSIGVIEYERDGEIYAYQAGGVFRGTGENTVVLSPPNTEYNINDDGEPTLSLPILQTSGDKQLNSGTITMRKNRTIAPLNNASIIRGAMVTVTIESEYYGGWYEHFNAMTDGTGVTKNESANTTTVELLNPVPPKSVESGMVATGAATTLDIENNAEIDSYNSSAGPYAISSGTTSEIVAAGDVVVSNNADVDGDVIAGGDVTIEKGTVDGNVSVEPGGTISVDSQDGTLTGNKYYNASVPSPSPSVTLIDQKRMLIESNNNNSRPGVDIDTSTNTLTGCSSTCSVEEGQYYLEEIDTGNDAVIELNASDGPIEIVVDGDVVLGNKAEIRVKGTHRVNMYIEGEVVLSQNSEVTVPQDRAPQYWMYVNPGTETAIENGVRFTGVLYGPANGTTEGTAFTLSQNAEVYGAIVGTIGEVENNYELHYDEALVGTRAVPESVTQIPSITYLHVSVHEVVVTDGDDD